MANRLELTQAYHKVSGSTLEAAAQAARSSFLSLGSWREDDIPRFIQQVVPAMNSAKRNMANYAVGYYKEMAGLAGEKFKMPNIDPASLTTEALRNGATEDMIWSRPFKSMWTSLSKGNDISDALEAGARRAVDLARTDVQLARRGAGLQARSSNDRIVGYIRTLSGAENCALCYVASTQRYKKKDLLPIHPGCDCGEMPIYGKDDPGQVIDDIRLEATHDAVETRFGIQDRGAREPDYRKIKIQDHGELGPVLTVRGDKFTKLTPARVDVPIKAPKKVEPKPFAEQIKKKTDKLSGTKIQSDILGEYNAPLTSERLEAIVEGKTSRWGKEVGPVASKYVDDVVSVGKRVDQEIVKRVDDAIAELTDPALAAQTRKQIDDLSQLSSSKIVELEAGKQQYIAKELAKEQQLLKKDIEFYRRAADGDDKFAEAARRQLDIYQSDEYQDIIQRRAKRVGREKWEKTQAYKKLNAENSSLQNEITALREIAENEVAPQSVAYERLYAEKAQEVISEVRELGGRGPNFVTNNKQLQALLEDAKKVYPKDWLDVAEQTYTEIQVKKVRRGSFGSNLLQSGKRRGRLNISTDKNVGVGADGYATTVHEMGHMMEDAVPGLKQLEWAYWRRRADIDPRRIKLPSDPEPGVVDNWRNTYSGKLYRGGGPEQNYEVFTTGVESVFGGAKFYYENGQGIYANPVAQTGTDDDFRQFILGVLLSL